MKKLLLFTAALAITLGGFAQTDLFFSEYVEGGGNNKALEIYNPTSQTISLADYQMSRYSNGETSPNYVQFPSGASIEPYDVYVVVLDKRDPNGSGQDTAVAPDLQAKADAFLCPVYNVNKMMYFNGNDAVSLEKISNGAMIDFFGAWNQDPGEGWCDNPDTYYMTSNFWEAWTMNHTLVRKPEIVQGVTLLPDVFNPAVEWDSLPRDTFDHLQWHDCVVGVNELKENLDFAVYPNPSSGEVVVIQGRKEIKTATIASAIGKVEKKIVFDGDMAKEVINLSELPIGLYFVMVDYVDGSHYTRKLQIR